MPDLMAGLDTLIQQVRDEADGKIMLLEKTKADLSGKPAAKRAPAAAPKPRKPRADKGKKRGRTGIRGEEALKMVTDKPGIEPPEIAKRMGIKTNYVYRVMGKLQKKGLVKKEDRAYYPQPTAAKAA